MQPSPRKIGMFDDLHISEACRAIVSAASHCRTRNPHPTKRAHTTLTHIALLLTLFFVGGCSDPGYDKARHDRMQRVIDGSTNKLLGLKLADASRLLALEGVPFDKGYTSAPDSELRVYHFNGFCLQVEITKRLPDSPAMWTSDEMNKRGKWYVDHFFPSLHVDRLTDSKQRMSNIWAETHESFRRFNASLKTNSAVVRPVTK
jgi:hypothetical protein